MSKYIYPFPVHDMNPLYEKYKLKSASHAAVPEFDAAIFTIVLCYSVGL
jgi:hypothetical protein